ncbi:hypothetical protein BI084_gp62 [Gordonia phage Terapin]|uniref:Uncharacterized protein n=5 Tax=Terapinvirus terapin TaxID=2734283 RepID=A0A345MBA1_9CAUD|nr:hypothetical protein BI084_gp62 [Gordonia phage Terapin]AVP43338.1 hypothetical protein PBI_DJOKOVIC_61 [Gordonia phage Djokovic]AXH67772.1 hypothetical protein SEA_BEYONCAGE_61 [Gordonia phage Beyoncage]QOC56206.1 hypothetical protein SEA_SIENNA_61 [Gordonia phage Sienna]QOC56631.1 hypothetical protein SEA_BITESIZE_61 [Gordonia phage BiteSize]QYW00864.1 hypothetical protein SEA_MADI_61 [Gordonia phage Madi]
MTVVHKRLRFLSDGINAITECDMVPAADTRWVRGVDVMELGWNLVTCEKCLGKRGEDLLDPDELEDDDWGFLVKPATKQGERVGVLMSEWWDEFVRKNADYQTSTGNVSENFGLMGQYMKLTDKIHKLRKPMHDAEILRQAEGLGADVDPDLYLAPFQFEGTEEILRDLIGHAFLALDFIKQQKEGRDGVGEH